MTGDAPGGLLGLGSPAPRALTRATRVLQVSVLTLISVWLFAYLGGLRLSPRPTAAGANDTSQLFNWHPLLLTLAFPALMAEAVLAYKAPLFQMQDRHQSKFYHFGLHTAAVACTILGVIAAFKSHTLKRPAPMPNLYSSHSYLGLAVLGLLGMQYLLAAFAYLWPKLSPAQRRALGPLHIFLGKAIFVAGIATMAVGIQEKQTFVQAFAKPASVYAAVMCLPAVIQVLLLLTALAVMYHHVPPLAPATQPWRQQLETDGADTAALVGTAELSSGDAVHFNDSHSA